MLSVFVTTTLYNMYDVRKRVWCSLNKNDVISKVCTVNKIHTWCDDLTSCDCVSHYQQLPILYKYVASYNQCYL